MCTYDTSMSVYIPHINSMQSTLSAQTLVYIHFTLLTCAPEHICLPHFIYVCLIANKLHITAYVSRTSKPVYWELSSNMHLATTFFLYHLWPLMYSLFGRHFVFSIYTNNLGNCTYMCTMPMKCRQPQTFYFCKPYLFFHIHDSFSTPCLSHICCLFCKCLWSFYCNSKTFQIWQPYLFLGNVTMLQQCNNVIILLWHNVITS